MTRLQAHQVGIAALTVGVQLTASGASLPASAYADAMAELSHYCVGDLCLGMTMEQVLFIGQPEFEKGTPPLSGVIDCSMFNPEPKASLHARDGSLYSLNFDVVGTTGTPGSRYRVSQVSKFVPGISQVQLDYLTRSVLDRFGNMQRIDDTASWLTDVRSMRIYVLAGGVGAPNLGPFISVSSSFKRRSEWLMGLEACKAALPKV